MYNLQYIRLKNVTKKGTVVRSLNMLTQFLKQTFELVIIAMNIL